VDGNRVRVAFQANRVGNFRQGHRDFLQNRKARRGYSVIAGHEVSCFLETHYQAARFRVDVNAACVNIFGQTVLQQLDRGEKIGRLLRRVPGLGTPGPRINRLP